MAPPQDERRSARGTPSCSIFKRVQEFVAEEILALAGIGLRRQRADGVERQLVAAVVGLARPDRQHDVAGHADLALDAGERVAVLRGELLAARGEPHRTPPRADIATASARIPAAAAAFPACPEWRGRAARDRARARAWRRRRSCARRRALARPAIAPPAIAGRRRRRMPAPRKPKRRQSEMPRNESCREFTTLAGALPPSGRARYFASSSTGV